MKQNISFSQLDELTAKQTVKLFEWGQNKGYLNENLFLPTIGQMIEFLDDNWNDWYMSYQDTTCNWYVRAGYLPDIEDPRLHFSEDELCDALWSACKQILEANSVE